MTATENMICPACKAFQPRADVCNKCGAIIEKAQATAAVTATEGPGASARRFPVAPVAAVVVIVVVLALILLSGGDDSGEIAGGDEPAAVPEAKPKTEIEKIAAVNPGAAARIQNQKVMSKLRELKTTLYMLGTEGGEPPSNEEGLEALVQQGHLRRVDITDEWGNVFDYRLEWGKDDGISREYKIFVHSNGPDGISGNADDIGLP